MLWALGELVVPRARPWVCPGPIEGPGCAARRRALALALPMPVLDTGLGLCLFDELRNVAGT